MADTSYVMTEEPLSISTTVTISSPGMSSDAFVLFKKPSRSAVWKYFVAKTERAVPVVQEGSFIQWRNNF